MKDSVFSTLSEIKERLSALESYMIWLIKPDVRFQIGQRVEWSRRGRRAATQVIFFHPDAMHFLFPDLNKWAGEVIYRNIPNPVSNPDGNIGFFRVLMTYAAKPVRPDCGAVVTMIPTGLRGRLWYWSWKLVKFVP